VNKLQNHAEKLLMPINSENVLTIDELADYLKLSKSSLYKLAQAGKVPGQKIGRHWRFHKEAIDLWLKERKPVNSHS
jgi:excisionase family DNA binding protein